MFPKAYFLLKKTYFLSRKKVGKESFTQENFTPKKVILFFKVLGVQGRLFQKSPCIFFKRGFKIYFVKASSWAAAVVPSERRTV